MMTSADDVHCFVQAPKFNPLGEQNQDTHHDSEQRNSFYQSCCDEHVGTDISHGFGLACNGLQCPGTNETYTNAGTDSSQTRTDTCTHEGIITCDQKKNTE